MDLLCLLPFPLPLSTSCYDSTSVSECSARYRFSYVISHFSHLSYLTYNRLLQTFCARFLFDDHLRVPQNHYQQLNPAKKSILYFFSKVCHVSHVKHNHHRTRTMTLSSIYPLISENNTLSLTVIQIFPSIPENFLNRFA